MVHRPTCHYAYYPCDDAVLSLQELANNDWTPQRAEIVLGEAFARWLEIQRPYLGPVVGVYTGWTPLDGTEEAGKPANPGTSDLWQFANVLVD